MLFCEKKIVYLSIYENEERVGAAGFAKISGEKEGIRLSIHVTKAGEGLTGKYPLFLLTENDEISLGNLTLSCGKGEYDRPFYGYEDKVMIGNNKIQPEEICAAYVQLYENRQIKGEWKKRKKTENEKMPREVAAAESAPEEKKIPQKEEVQTPFVLQEIYPGNKWEQLLKQYKNIHPFGDDRLFIAMEPKDFVILSEPYQKLVNNSFLLHGFYNYRHIILGKDHKMGSSFETCFYLGVPGVFFEREKMVAVMFGFEGFECAGAVETGKFGYYMRQVEI